MFVLPLIPAVSYVLMALILRAPLSPWSLGYLIAGGIVIFVFRRKSLYLLIFLLLSLALLLFQVLLIPGSVYQAWYLLLSDRRPEGTVSGLFALTAGILSLPGYLELIRRCWYKGALYLLLSVGLLLVLLFPGWISLAGVILLLGAVFLREIPKKERNSWNTGGIPALLLLALLFSRLPADTEQIRGSPVVNRLSNSLREKVLRSFPRYPLVFSLPGYGFSYQEASGGGRPILTPAVLFEVDGQPGEVLYLKTESYSRFSGHLWTKDPAVVPEKIGAEGAAAYADAREILVLAEYFQRLPYTAKTEILDLNGETFYQVGSLTEGLEQPSGFPLRMGSTISLYEGEPSLPPEELDPRYLELPDIAEYEYGRLARQFARDDPLETVTLLRNYLIRDFTYSLDTESSDSPIADFLFRSNKGYCVHFASAFAVLARMNGIPTRLAGGFRVTVPEPEESFRPMADSVTITGYAAHRWPEIFVPGRGWVIVEVTPPFTGEDVQILDIEDSQTRLLLESLGEAVRDTPQPVRETDRHDPFSYRFMLWGVPAVLAGLVFLFLRFQGKNARLEREVRRAVRYYKKQGVASPEEIGWVAWIKDASHNSPGLSRSRSELEHTLLRFAYGPEEASPPPDRIRRILKDDHRTRNREA